MAGYHTFRLFARGTGTMDANIIDGLRFISLEIVGFFFIRILFLLGFFVYSIGDGLRWERPSIGGGASCTGHLKDH